MKHYERPHTTVGVDASTMHFDNASDKLAAEDAKKKASFDGCEPNISRFINDGCRFSTYYSPGSIDQEKAKELHVKHWDEKGDLPATSYLTVSAGGWDAIFSTRFQCYIPPALKALITFGLYPVKWQKNAIKGDETTHGIL